MKHTRRNDLIFIASAVLVILFAALAIFVIIPSFTASSSPGGQLGLGADVLRAEVLAIKETGLIQLGETEQEYQILQIRVLEAPYEGVLMDMDYGRRQLRPPGPGLQPGDQIYVTISPDFDGYLQPTYIDFVRSRPLALLFGAFLLMSVLISGWKGVRSILGMAISLGVILYYIIPQILQGRDPIWVSVSGAFFLLAVTLYLVYGWTLKTHAAVLGTLVSLLITAFLAGYFVNLTHLTGYGTEEAMFLAQQAEVRLNLRGLVLGGMLIGALGVLDDLVITQASVVFELRASNPAFTLRELFRRAMRVGQDHVAATVNTLVLAYAGAALPMFLLFALSGENLLYLINLEYVTEEIVRTLVGSLGLIASVPLTTLLACLAALYQHKLGRLRPYLGPDTLGDDHGHGHAH